MSLLHSRITEILQLEVLELQVRFRKEFFGSSVIRIRLKLNRVRSTDPRVFLSESILQEFFVYVSKHQNCSNSGSPVIEKIEKVIYRKYQCCEYGLFIQDLDFTINLGSWIQQEQQKRRGE